MKINIIYILILFLYSNVFSQKNPVFPTENTAVEILLTDKTVIKLEEHVKELRKLEKSLNETNIQVIKLSKLILSEPDKKDIIEKNSALEERIDQILIDLRIKKGEIVLLNNIINNIKGERKEMKKEYKRLLQKYKIDFYSLQQMNYRQQQENFFSELKYRVEIMSQNIIHIDEHILFARKGKVVERNGIQINSKKYHDILLKNCYYKIPSYPKSEIKFETDCVFIMYDKSGIRVQSEPVYLEEQEASSLFSKTYKIKDDYGIKVKKIILDEKIRSKDIDKTDYRFLLVEKTVYDDNEAQFKFYKKAINKKIIISNDPEIVAKSLDNLMNLSKCDKTYSIKTTLEYIHLKLYDYDKQDNDRVLMTIDDDNHSEEIELLKKYYGKNIKLDYLNTLRFSVANTGEHQDICTLGIRLGDSFMKELKLKESDSVCIDIIKD